MFTKRFFIPMSIVFIAIALTVGGTFWGQHIAGLQEPTKVINVVPVEPVEVERTRPKPPPPGETVESRYWHGDEWHTDLHEPVLEVSDAPVEDYRDTERDAYEASLAHFTAEERATYDRVLSNEIARHREKYPNCQEHVAVWEDADRFARWYMAELKHRKIMDAARTEWEALVQQPVLPTNYQELVQLRDTLSDAEKAVLIEKANNWQKRLDAGSKRYDEVSQQGSVSPQPLHTH